MLNNLSIAEFQIKNQSIFRLKSLILLDKSQFCLQNINNFFFYKF